MSLNLLIAFSKDALRAIFNNKAVVVAEYKLIIRSVSVSINLPSVIALKKFHRKPNNIPVMTRRYIFIRDGYRCQVQQYLTISMFFSKIRKWYNLN